MSIKMLRMYRGLAVPAAERDRLIEKIRTNGIAGGEGRWNIIHQHPGDIEALFASLILNTPATRFEDTSLPKVVCACGEPDGASYYACRHNRSKVDDTPLVIEFDAPLTDTAIDGRDFLYTVFQMGNPDAARPALRAVFGEGIIRYADRAWLSKDQGERIALCDLAIHDPSVIEAHHANRTVIGGRSNTVFRSAFTVICPIPSECIRSVSTPEPDFMPPGAEIDFRDLLKKNEDRSTG